MNIYAMLVVNDQKICVKIDSSKVGINSAHAVSFEYHKLMAALRSDGYTRSQSVYGKRGGGRSFS